MNNEEVKFVNLNCIIQLKTKHTLYELADILSEKVFGGMKFCNEDFNLRDEYPALEIFPHFLNFQIILMDCLEDNLFELQLHMSPYRNEYFFHLRLFESIQGNFFLFHTINSFLYDYDDIEVIGFLDE